jgi:hypothetical protein
MSESTESTNIRVSIRCEVFDCNGISVDRHSCR